MQKMDLKLDKPHGTQGGEARGSFFASFCRRSSRKPTLCNHFCHIISILNSHMENFGNEESLKETSISLWEIWRRSAEGVSNVGI